MKVEMLRNPSKSYGCKLAEGETGEVSDAVGDLLVSAGVAVCREVKAVVPEQEAEVVKPEPAPAVKPGKK